MIQNENLLSLCFLCEKEKCIKKMIKLNESESKVFFDCPYFESLNLNISSSSDINTID